ncbi:major facilitator superfamily domain-containing protein [Aspergillus egyptiacus]|nr:major facilitator superfamily domain-containing protein [Aspergillus egyptiacus]
MLERIQGWQWRSSSWFIVSAMSVALFTDTFLSSFIVPILPYMLEQRLGLDPAHTQTLSSGLLSGSAAVSVAVRIPLGHFADRSVSKRSWLLWALVIALVSTVFVALEISVVVLFLARFVQSLASSIMWVVGIITVADNVPVEHLGKAYGTLYVAVSASTSVGPMLSGVLLELAGYWVAWSSAFAVLGIDIVFRLLMVEKHDVKQSDDTIHDAPAERNPDTEDTPLLRDQPTKPITATEARPPPPPPPSFYRCILRKPVFIGGIYASFMGGVVNTTFHATLPLHVREVFHWGGMSAGLMFAALQAPRIVVSPFVGWLKDRVGTRAPTAFGFVSLAPAVWLLGVPGNEHFPGVNVGHRAETLYVIAMVLIGALSSFLGAAGTLEAVEAVNELKQEHPHAFGPNGGKSRALALNGVCYILGTFAGPILGGALYQSYSYYVMNCVVAGICALSAAVAWGCLRSKRT